MGRERSASHLQITDPSEHKLERKGKDGGGRININVNDGGPGEPRVAEEEEALRKDEAAKNFQKTPEESHRDLVANRWHHQPELAFTDDS